MKNCLFLLIFISSLLFGANYAAASTQELLAIVNYTVIKKDQNSILKELKSRVNEMSSKQRKEYLKIVKQIKKKDAK